MTQELFSLLAGRLLAVRKESGLSQADFAARVGTSTRAYKNYELGLRDVPLSVIVAINIEFGVEFDWLIMGRGASNSENTENINEKIVFGIRSFEEDNNTRFSKEKAITVFNYLFYQMANGRTYSNAEIHAYLKTTL